MYTYEYICKYMNIYVDIYICRWAPPRKTDCNISRYRCVLQSVAVCCSVLQCVAVCCSVLQSVLQCVGKKIHLLFRHQSIVFV